MSDGPEPGGKELGTQGSTSPSPSQGDEFTAPDPVEDVDDDFEDDDTTTIGTHPPLTREELLEGVRTQLTCPDGRLEIDAVNTRVEIVEDCEEVIITGDISQIAAQHVGSLTVAARGVNIIVVSVDSVEVTEDGDVSLVA